MAWGHAMPKYNESKTRPNDADAGIVFYVGRTVKTINNAGKSVEQKNL